LFIALFSECAKEIYQRNYNHFNMAHNALPIEDQASDAKFWIRVNIFWLHIDINWLFLLFLPYLPVACYHYRTGTIAGLVHSPAWVLLLESCTCLSALLCWMDVVFCVSPWLEFSSPGLVMTSERGGNIFHLISI
jgi:hypothetical protein